MKKLQYLERLIKNHRYRSQVASKVAKRFSASSVEYLQIMSSLDDVVRTHSKTLRRNGEMKKHHEFALLVMGLEFCPKEDVSFYIGLIKHDMVEDYNNIWPISRIIQEDGQVVTAIVSPLTAPKHKPRETKPDYSKRKFAKVARGGELPKRVKILDRLHNIYTLPNSGTQAKQMEYLEETVKYILPWAQELSFMEEELSAILRKHKRRLRRYIQSQNRRL